MIELNELYLTLMAYFIVWDEVSSCKKGITPREAWEDVLEPALRTRWSWERAKKYGARSAGRMLAISTPKGYNYFQTLHVREEMSPEWKSFHYDYHQSPYIDPEEIEKLRHVLDPVTFNSEYLALFAESGYSVFYCFKRTTHVTSDLIDFYPPEGDEPGEDVHACIDFNVGWYTLADVINSVNSGNILIGQS